VPGTPRGCLSGCVAKPQILNPESLTLHATSYALHPTRYILHPTPYTLHPTPCTLHPTPYTLHPTPYTLHPKFFTSTYPHQGKASTDDHRLRLGGNDTSLASPNVPEGLTWNASAPQSRLDLAAVRLNLKAEL
jgi:hypothetical protein